MRSREFRFPVEISWEGGRRTSAHVAGKQSLEIVPPPEFRGPDPSTWSPEDAFVTAAASCLAVTITGLVERTALPLHALAVSAEGVVGARDDGKFGFTAIHQTVDLETETGHEEEARSLVARAEDGCLVSVSLALPVETIVNVRTREAVPIA
jgi:peroxiredoxin-like protein